MGSAKSYWGIDCSQGIKTVRAFNMTTKLAVLLCNNIYSADKDQCQEAH